MRCTLTLPLLAILSATLVSSLPTSLTVRELTPDEASLEVSAAASPSPSIVKIAEPTMPADAQFIEPPPLFDPLEPRPNPLFENPGEQPFTENISHEPPMPTDRKEVLLPFDGAHVHPENTPYPPEEGMPGTCSHSWHCSWLRTCVEMAATLVGILMIAWACIWTIQRVVRGIVRTARSRTRSPSGSLRIEPEVKRKDETTGPLLQAWALAEKETPNEKKVSFAV
ncbi:MAG: hypothetical protein LQ340_000115 [Diploschistes diacapsis]|nr:MAG: hypothetical protein LQ340_000115 [Diploschistes diacapsis]